MRGSRRLAERLISERSASAAGRSPRSSISSVSSRRFMRPGSPAAAPDDERASRVKRCLACGAEGVANRCGGCRRVFFCGRECQRQAWGEHRAECLRIRAEAQQEEAERIPDAQQGEKQQAEEALAQDSERQQVVEALAQNAEKQRVGEAQVQDGEACKEEEVCKPHVEIVEVSAAGSHKKKSKSKHKRKKARSKSLHLPNGTGDCPSGGARKDAGGDGSLDAKKRRSVSLGARKHVMWGQVLAREFERFPGGGSAVPYDGTWALGLGSRVADVTLGSVLEVEELKHEELKMRAKELPKTQRTHVREGETRQFDYRRGVDNPLFSRLTERERKQLFAAEKMPSPLLLAKAPPKADHHHHNHHGRRRKNSVSASPVISALSAPFVLDDAPLDSPDFACVSVEQLQEFVKIRDSRDEECGCSCGDLVKKVAKMHVKKLVAFLHERGVEDTQGLGKPQLLALAKKVAAEEKNCQSLDSDCECARNGVPCHSDVCLGCAGDCYNPFNCYQYKKDEVRAYRKQMIADWKAQHEDSESLGEAMGPAVQVA